MPTPTPQPGILDIATYVPGESGAGGNVKPIKLSSNESPLGPSPKAVTAIRAAAEGLHLYPDSGSAALREALAAANGIEAARIVCGSGSDELLFMLAAAYLGPATEALITEHAFAIFHIATRARSATPVFVPERNLTTDVDAILARVTERTRMVFLANPNNPTGTVIPFPEVRRLHAGLPEHVLLVLDAAYAEFVDREDYEAGYSLARGSDNVVVTRTFSKAHGLAGVRLGWLYGPPAVVDALHRIRPSFNCSVPAQAAGLAALADPGHMAATIAHNKVWLPWMAEQLKELGLNVTPSAGNFHLVIFPQDERLNAAAAFAFLKARHIYLRPVASYGLGYALRLSIGTEAENKAVIAALIEFMGKDRLR